MALKNAWLGDKIGPEGGMALENAGFRERGWTGRMHGFEECMGDARP